MASDKLGQDSDKTRIREQKQESEKTSIGKNLDRARLDKDKTRIVDSDKTRIRLGWGGPAAEQVQHPDPDEVTRAEQALPHTLG